MSPPARGEIWLADLNPIRGHEQAGRRPVLIVSDDLFNQGPAGLVVALPLTSTLRPIRMHVRVSPHEGGLRVPSAVICEGIRSLSKERLIDRWGAVSAKTLVEIEERLRILLRL